MKIYRFCSGLIMEAFVVELSNEEEKLRELIEPLLASEGFELVRICYKRAQAKSLLALYIDTVGDESAIEVEKLTFASRFLSDVLDASQEAEAIIRGRYDLEISSPGLDRPLTKKSHFLKALGARVKVRLKEADDNGVKTHIGVLKEVFTDALLLEPEASKILEKRILFDDIFLAHVIFEFEKTAKKKNN